METLGKFLSSARIKLGLTLREVESATGISNAYLSQLEGGKIRSPSPVHLHKLSELYKKSYAQTLMHAGYPVPKGNDKTEHSRFLALIGPTTSEEEEALLEYLQFLRAKRRKGRRK